MMMAIFTLVILTKKSNLIKELHERLRRRLVQRPDPDVRLQVEPEPFVVDLAPIL
jgi:predicted metal-dependent RNase